MIVPTLEGRIHPAGDFLNSHPFDYRVVKGGGSLIFPKVPQSSLGILRNPTTLRLNVVLFFAGRMLNGEGRGHARNTFHPRKGAFFLKGNFRSMEIVGVFIVVQEAACNDDD